MYLSKSCLFNTAPFTEQVTKCFTNETIKEPDNKHKNTYGERENENVPEYFYKFRFTVCKFATCVV